MANENGQGLTVIYAVLSQNGIVTRLSSTKTLPNGMVLNPLEEVVALYSTESNKTVDTKSKA